MHRDRYKALMAARDDADDDHVAAIRFAINYIGRLERRLSEVHAMGRAIVRATTYANDTDADTDNSADKED